MTEEEEHGGKGKESRQATRKEKGHEKYTHTHTNTDPLLLESHQPSGRRWFNEFCLLSAQSPSFPCSGEG
eukprot:6732948-Pyramimonas_sp.AAC.1